MVDTMKSRCYAEVYQIHDENKQTHSMNWEQRVMEVAEFSLRDNYDEIAQKICKIYNAGINDTF